MMNKSLSKYSDSTSEEANKRLIKLTRDGMIGFKKTNKERIPLQATCYALMQIDLVKNTVPEKHHKLD